jgi:hypothetical protein
MMHLHICFPTMHRISQVHMSMQVSLEESQMDVLEVRLQSRGRTRGNVLKRSRSTRYGRLGKLGKTDQPIIILGIPVDSIWLGAEPFMQDQLLRLEDASRDSRLTHSEQNNAEQRSFR